MKKKMMVALTMVLALANVQDVAAQSFWKTLGKVAEKVLTTDIVQRIVALVVYLVLHLVILLVTRRG